MPNAFKPPAKGGVDRRLSKTLERKTERPRFDPRDLPNGKGYRGDKVRGGRPPRFPGRIGGR